MKLFNYKDFLLENNNSSHIIIEKDTNLFHSTGETFDYKKLRVGSYDKILWTTTDSVTSQTYIPISGSTSFVRSSEFIVPSRSESTQEQQKQLGIEFDYSDIEFKNGHALSFGIPSVFQDITAKHNEKRDEYYNLKKEIHEIGLKPSKDIDIQDLKRKVKLKEKLEEELFGKNELENKKLEYVNKQLQSLGYEPMDNEPHNFNKRWKLRTNLDKILRADEQLKGKLIILKVIEPLKIYDMTLGENIEGDLTDLDYHKIPLFRKIEEKGYDGVKINDFAQSETEGNTGHTSIGIFGDSIEKLKVIDAIDAVHPIDYMDRHRKHQGKSIEYEKYLSN